MIEIAQSDLEKLLQMFNQLAEESGESLKTTEGTYLAGYYCGTQDTALTVVDVLKTILSGGSLPDKLALIDRD